MAASLTVLYWRDIPTQVVVRAGVPAFFWGQSGEGFNYWDSHHSQHDTFDKAMPEYQEHSSIVIALAA